MVQTKINKQGGFTLIELIVVVVILGILSAFIAPKMFGRAGDARIQKETSDITALDSILEVYKLDNFSYPTTDQGLDALVNKPAGDQELNNWQAGGYVKKLQKDPWGREYLYDNEGDSIRIYTLGADGTEGGDGENADLSNLD